MKIWEKVIWGLTGAAAFALAVACGGDNPGGPSGGSGGGGTGGGGGTSGTTITITSSGVNPKNLIVPRGTQVTFTNSSSVPHDMASDPHPSHENCPEIESVRFLTMGQSKQTMNLNTAKTCGYHDHNRDFDTSLQGTITIQ